MRLDEGLTGVVDSPKQGGRETDAIDGAAQHSLASVSPMRKRENFTLEEPLLIVSIRLILSRPMAARSLTRWKSLTPLST